MYGAMGGRGLNFSLPIGTFLQPLCGSKRWLEIYPHQILPPSAAETTQEVADTITNLINLMVISGTQLR